MPDKLDGHHKRTVRRSLFVGLGGTGKEVIRLLKREMLQHGYGDLPIFQYAVLDTVESKEESGMEPLVGLNKREEYIHIGDYNPNEVIRHLDQWPTIGNWWGNRRETTLVTVDEGAGQMRSVGRMSFFYRFNEIKKQLTRMVNTIMKTDTREIAYEKGFEVSDLGPIVYLVFSLCGGTGSGLFLDAAYVARQLFSTSAKQPTVVGIGMLPGPYIQLVSAPQQERIRANAYASLLELERIHNMAMGQERRPNGKDLWNVQYPTNFEVASANLPFDYMYLIDDTNAVGEKYTADQLYEKLSQAMFWLSAPATAARFWEGATNLSTKSLAGGGKTDASGTKRLPFYSSLGISTVTFEWQMEQVQYELENAFIDHLYAQKSGKLSLPLFLNKAENFLREVSDEKTGVNPLPVSKKLRPIGTFNDRVAVDEKLEEITTKYLFTLSRLLASPAWQKTRRQYLENAKKEIEISIREGLCTRGPIAIKQELEEGLLQLNTLHTELREKQQEQETLKSQLQEQCEQRTNLTEREGFLWKLLRESGSVIRTIFLSAASARRLNARARALETLANDGAQQRYLWYSAGFQALIYSDARKTILEPLIALIKTHIQVLDEIDRDLLKWQSRNKKNMSARLRNQGDRAWFERIRPGATETEQVQKAITSGDLKIAETLRQILKRTFDAWPEQNALAGSVLTRQLKQEIVEQLKDIGEEEHLAQRLLAKDVSSERTLFLQGAECLWNFSGDTNEETRSHLEPINLVGYGVDARQQQTAASLKKTVEELFKNETPEPILVPTDISEELAFLKTQHGLMVSALSSIKSMQDAYQIMKTIRRAPYLHTDATYEVAVGYKPLTSLQSTPQLIITLWRKAADRLDNTHSDIADEILDIISGYEQSGQTASKLQEQLDIDKENHPFFDFVERLRTLLRKPNSTPAIEQTFLLLAEMEALLHVQGWIEIEPGPKDLFDSGRHQKVGEESNSNIKAGRVVETAIPGYERHRINSKGKPTAQIRKAQVIVSAP